MYVELENINKTYGNYRASDHVSLGVEQGKLVALLGPSGSGKTTVLRILAGLETPDSGEIRIAGQRMNDVPPAQRGIGFVFQNYALFRYKTVFDNIAFGLEIQKVPKKQIQERVQELVELIGLAGLEKRYPNQLSGGQRQRVAFARALAPRPKLLLLDEPFAAIDAKVRTELRTWLKETIHKVGITSIFVTHDQDEAVEVADEIIVTSHGRVEQAGTPMDIYKNPKTRFVASFIGEAIQVEDYSRLRGFSHSQHGQGAVVRPEFVEAFKSDNDKFKNMLRYSEEGTIEDIAFRGSFLQLTLNVQGLRLVTHRSLERRPVQLGETMRVIVYRVYAYDGDKVYLLENEELQGKKVVSL
ncbi:MAG: ABC transporter ATP-binding protein [Oscillospiraceae bacterium]|jgi:sulfate transport system ATP-binding protein|nr:ABC transporter ATP-binding protein [Oscillospiraceae bacterium]